MKAERLIQIALEKREWEEWDVKKICCAEWGRDLFSMKASKATIQWTAQMGLEVDLAIDGMKSVCFCAHFV